MYARPLNTDDSSVLLADWVEIELAGRGGLLSIDEVADDLHDEPDDDSGADNREEAREKAEEAFQELARRSSWLGQRYPLEVEGEVAEWSLGSTSEHLGRFLTLLRAKQMYPGATWADDSDEAGFLFEETATLAAQSYAGPRGVRFGLAQGRRGHGLPNPLPEAIRELSRRMDEQPAEDIKDGGDFRADAVAWRPFGDNHPGQLVMLCQATISERRWMDKEIPPRWKDGRLIQLYATPLPAVAFVESMSIYSMDFFKGHGEGSIPFDRLRILSLVSDGDFEREIMTRMQNWSLAAVGKLQS